MKLHGQKITGPNTVLIPIPRGTEDQIVFTAQAVLSYTDFDAKCPTPTPRRAVSPGGGSKLLTEEPQYIEKMDKYTSLRIYWMVLQSLKATEGLEWETVDFDDPKTWVNYETELRTAGMSDIEVGRIVRGVMQANALDDEMVEAARKRFLASQLAEAQESRLKVEPLTTKPGEPAKG